MTDTSVKSKRRRLNADVKEFAPGDMLDGKYKVTDTIGSSAVSRVYSAKHLVLDQTVVVKVIHDQGQYEEETKERFRREGRILVGLHHDNIVKVSDAGLLSNGFPYVVMPYLEGETLKAWMKRTPLVNRSFLFIEEVIVAVCKGLFVAHKNNIVHRDLKPQNIFLHRNDEEGQITTVPKILDFGMAGYLSGIKDDRLTLPNQSFGTEGYMSPEQTKGDNPDKRSDIFSVGCILYELLTDTKVNPYKPAIPPMKLNAAVPRELSKACMKALESNPDQRYQSAVEFADALWHRALEKKTALREDGDEDGNKKLSLYLVIPIFALSLAAIAAGIVYWTGQPLTIRPDTHKTDTDKKSAVPKVASKAVPKTAAPSPDVSLPSREESPNQANAAPAIVDSKMYKPSKKTTSPQSKGHETKSDVAPSSAESSRIDRLTAEAESLLRQNRFLDAEPILEEVVRFHPKDARVWYGLGTIAFEKKDYQTSVNQIEKALTLQDKTEWRIMLGHALSADHQKDRARAEWKTILSSPNISQTIRSSVEKLLSDLGEE